VCCVALSCVALRWQRHGRLLCLRPPVLPCMLEGAARSTASSTFFWYYPCMLEGGAGSTAHPAGGSDATACRSAGQEVGGAGLGRQQPPTPSVYRSSHAVCCGVLGRGACGTRAVGGWAAPSVHLPGSTIARAQQQLTAGWPHPAPPALPSAAGCRGGGVPAYW
jgi:hypothetical protein